MRRKLKIRLKEEYGFSFEDIYNSFDIVGDIAILRKLPNSKSDIELLANNILESHRNVKTVLAQTSSVHGEHRLRNLVFLKGENKRVTLHKESGCCFSVNVEDCFFTPRLSYERMRTANLVKPNEIVVNMFAGVGCFSILIAKYAHNPKVFSIDINPVAFEFMNKNIKLNNVEKNVIALLGDSKRIIENVFQNFADRVIMPLPERAMEYLPYAHLALKSSGGWIHYHDFVRTIKNENTLFKLKKELEKQLHKLDIQFESLFARKVRSVGPNRFHVVVDIHVKPSR